MQTPVITWDPFAFAAPAQRYLGQCLLWYEFVLYR